MFVPPLSTKTSLLYSETGVNITALWLIHAESQSRVTAPIVNSPTR